MAITSNLILNQFDDLPLETQTVIWQQLTQQPQVLGFFKTLADNTHTRLRDLPEPENMSYEALATNAANRKALRAYANVFDEILSIDKMMREKSETD